MIGTDTDTPSQTRERPGSLGDELRAERALLGKSLLDVQRDLKIKAAHIDAIENADPSAIPYSNFVVGYVRAYARYLSLDDAVVLRRFCEESGFDVAAAASTDRLHPGRGGPSRASASRNLDALITDSRLAQASRAESFEATVGVAMRAAGSFGALAAVVGGVWWGAATVLESVQRVGFAPTTQEPQALVSPPRVAQAGVGPAAVIDPAALSALYAAQEAPPRAPALDGPIRAIDPSRSGVYAAPTTSPSPPVRPTAALEAGGPAGPDAAERALAAVVDPQAAPAVVDSVAPQEGEAAVAVAPTVVDAGVVLVAREEAWVRVRDAGGRVAHEALMPAGAQWRAPRDATGYTLRAGNAGGVYLRVDGALHGPLGRPGAVVSNVSLDSAAIAELFPEAPEPSASAAVNAALATR